MSEYLERAKDTLKVVDPADGYDSMIAFALAALTEAVIALTERVERIADRLEKEPVDVKHFDY